MAKKSKKKGQGKKSKALSGDLILPADTSPIALLQSLDQLGDLETIQAALRGSIDNAGAMQYVKVHQANSAFPGIITRGVDMVKIEEDDQWLADFRYEVGHLWRDGADVTHQQYVPWYHPAANNPPPKGHKGKVKRAYRVYLIGLSEAHAGVIVELGGDSNGIMQFVNAIKLNLDQHLATKDKDGKNIGMETPYPVLTIATASYPSRYAKDTLIYKPVPTFIGWKSEEEVQELGGAASVQALKSAQIETDGESEDGEQAESLDQGTAKAVEGEREDAPEQTKRPRRRSLA